MFNALVQDEPHNPRLRNLALKTTDIVLSYCGKHISIYGI